MFTSFCHRHHNRRSYARGFGFSRSLVAIRIDVLFAFQLSDHGDLANIRSQ